MAKMRIYELARELVESGLAKDSKSLNTDIINLLSENGIEGKSHSSGLEENEAELVRNHYKNKGEKKPQKEVKPEAKTETKEEPKTEVKADSKPEEKAAAPSVVRHPENSEKKGAPKQQRVPAGKLIGKDGKETPYWIAKDGRLVAMDGKALPLKMGPNGKIVKLDGSPLQKRPAPAPKKEQAETKAPEKEAIEQNIPEKTVDTEIKENVDHVKTETSAPETATEHVEK